MTKNLNIKPTIDFIYNPDNQSKNQLVDSFVVRLKVFKRLFSDIKEAKMTAPEQHHLIEGKRGMGKTTLLLRLSYEIENDEVLNTWLLPIVFNEEEYSIRRLFKLWERIAILLEDTDDLFFGLHEDMDQSYDQYESEEEYEYAIFQLLNKTLEKHEKKLILFIDNFGDIFSKFNKQEVQRLRTVLQTNANFRIFGASSKVLESFYDNKHPFFEFFKVTRLRGLDKEETKDLLLKLGETYKQEQIKEIIQTQQGRIEALRRLTGGVIRTIVLLFEIFIDQKQGSAFSDLEAILDRVTPLYKHRMDDLPAQQQAIVEAIAFAWDAVNVSEISQKTRIASKTISAQLRQMEKNEIITKKLSNNKNHFYQIIERFFNIWYLMRHGRKGDKRKVLWLVRFLEEWCDEGELIERTNRHIASLKNGEYNVNGAYFLSEALASTKGLPTKEQDELIKITRQFLIDKNSEYVKHLSDSDLELLEKVFEYYENKNYRKAISVLHKMKVQDEYKTALCHYELNEIHQVEKLYLKAIEKGKVNAMYNLAILYQNEFKDFTKAEKFYLKAMEKGHTSAMYNLGYLYEYGFKDFAKAEKFYILASDGGSESAMSKLAYLYYCQSTNKEKALELAQNSYELENNDASRLAYAKTLLWNNKTEVSKKIAKEFLYDKKFHSDYLEFFSDYLFLLLAKEQYTFLYEYFTSPKAEALNIKDQLKPIWYALMYYMQDQYPNEYLRMGEELEETVKEIIEKVEQMREDYA